MKKIVIAWPGFTGYMGACFAALARRCDLKVFIEPSRYEQRFGAETMDGVSFRRVDPQDEYALSDALEAIRSFGPDLVLVCGWSTPLSRALARDDLRNGQKRPRKVLAFDMPWEWSPRKILARWALHPLLRAFDAAFVPGRRCARYARWLGFRHERLLTGSNPSGCERFAPPPAARGFLFAGRFASEKGLDTLLAAYAAYRKTAPTPWTLDLVGAGDDLPAALPEGVRNLGFVPPAEMPRVFSEHAALVLPSRWEPWGVCAAEAMSAGLATILSDACGLTDDLKPTLTVPTDDIPALADALARLAGLTPEERASEAARARAQAEPYAAAHWAERVLRLAEKPGPVCLDPWEEHCVECGEPDCYATCPKFRRARTGRCRRLENGRFRPWGKLELLWHGGLASRRTARAFRLANALLEPLALALGPFAYRPFRSVRWRVGRALARHRTPPTLWRIACTSAADAELFASVARPDGAEILRHRLALRAGVECAVEIPLPAVTEGTLFRIAAYDGTEAPVTFRENELVDAFVSNASNKGIPAFSGLKCVAWDLDGTLWDGTLSEGDDVRPRPAVVDLIRRLDAAGVVNSICSKNDADVARTKLRAFGLEELFVFPQINWGAKSDSLRRLAAELNIGRDTIAFVDDRPENREEVRRNLPEIRVLDEREALPALDPRGATDTLGPARRLAYRAEMARREALGRDFGGDAESFAAQSDLTVELLPVTDERAARCRELLDRTNQLTITARRYTDAQFADLCARCETRAVHVRDRYGDFGLVGFVAWDATRVEELVFSCRVAHRGVERRVLDALPKGLAITVVETPRNAPIREIVAQWKEAHP